jgi:prepilin-type N-terminal cleavage/methylation domain-containing protein
MNESRGFTLIELLVVMGIIGVLSALLFTNFTGVRERARDAQRKNDLTQVKNALRLYYNDYQQYPDSTATPSSEIAGCGLDGTEACIWGETFSAGAGPTIYMNQLPEDPLEGQVYTYTFVNDDSYMLRAMLENRSDDAAAKSQMKCGVPEGSVEDFVFLVCPE